MCFDLAPFFANLFLFYYNKWIKKTKKNVSSQARRFADALKFGDVFTALNDDLTCIQEEKINNKVGSWITY